MGQGGLKSVEEGGQGESSRQQLLQKSYKVHWGGCTSRVKLQAPCSLLLSCSGQMVSRARNAVGC